MQKNNIRCQSPNSKRGIPVLTYSFRHRWTHLGIELHGSLSHELLHGRLEPDPIRMLGGQPLDRRGFTHDAGFVLTARLRAGPWDNLGRKITMINIIFDITNWLYLFPVISFFYE